MVTDKPPRRTKSNKEPVTIDATASRSDTVAEPVRSNDTDDTPVSAGTTPSEKDFTPTPPSSAQATSVPGPVSPDATAARPEVLAAPIRSNDKDEMPGSAASVTLAGDAAQKNTAADDAGTAPKLAAGLDKPKSTESKPEADKVSAKTEPSYPKSSASSSPVPPSASTPTDRKGTSTSALVAAGIAGGIVALALAGSMQYAGYLPAASAGADVTDEIAALRQQVGTLSQAPASDPEIDSRLQAIESAVATAASDTGASDELNARLSSMEQELATLRTTAEGASSETAGRLDQLQQRLDAAEAELNAPGAEEAAAHAIAAAALKAAVDRGGSFENELQTFVSVAPDDSAVAQLQAFSAAGVPTRSQLVEQFSALSGPILEAVQQPDQDQGIAGRLMSSAMSVVTVRRTGDAEGETPEAAVSRIENALQGEDLQTAASEWETLPQEAKAVSEDFKQALDARIAIDALLGDTLTRAVTETRSSN